MYCYPYVKAISIRFFLLIICVLHFGFLSLLCAQSPLAPALKFNVFVRNGASFKGSETQGPIAVGGNLTLNGDHTAASQSPGSFKASSTTIGLLVGGKVIYQSGNQFNVNNNAYVKLGDCTGSKVWYKDNNGASSNIQITKGKHNANPRINIQTNASNLGVSEFFNPVCDAGLIDFNTAFMQLQDNSKTISSCPNDIVLTDIFGRNVSNYENLPFLVKTKLNTGINILNISGNSLNGILNLSIDGGRPDANHILVININAPGNFTFTGIRSGDLGSGEGAYILYNFYNTTKLIINPGDQTPGSILAPFADIIKDNDRNHIGQIIGQSLEMNSGAIQYKLFEAEVKGCGGTCSMPVVSPITGEDGLCKSKTIQLSSSTTGGVWGSDDASIATVDNTGIVSGVNVGTVNIHYTVTNDCGATKISKSITIRNVPDKPVITAESATSFCPGGSVVLTGTAGFDYQWYRDGIKLDGAVSQSYTVRQEGRYSVVAGNTEGCSSAAANSVTTNILQQPATPFISVSGSSTVCIGQIVLLSSSAASDNNWYKDGDLITAERNTSFNASSPGVYTVAVLNEGGCISSQSAGVDVIMNPVPAISPITGSGSVCAGSKITLSNNTSDGSWASSDESIAVIHPVTGFLTGLREGTVLITYTITNTATGCFSSVSHSVIVNSVPATTPVSGPGSTCQGTSAQMVNSKPDGAWSSSNTNVMSISSNGLASSVSQGTTVISYTITSEYGCKAVSEQTVTVNALPVVSGNSVVQLQLCVNASATLSNNTADGVWTSDNQSIATVSSNGVVTGIAPGTAVIMYTVTNQSGCSSMVSTNVTINAIPASQEINANSATTVCAGETVTLTSNIISGNRWYRDGVLIASGNNQQSYTAAQSGTYTAIVVSAAGCEGRPGAGIKITVEPIPITPVITANSATTFCSGNSVTLRSSISSGNNWYKDGTLIPGANGQTYSATTGGAYTVKTVTANQCSSALSSAITVIVNNLPTMPTVNTGSTTTFCDGNNVVLTAGTSGSIAGYQWTKDNTAIPGANSSTYTAITSGNYKVIVSNSNGCSATAATGIQVTVHTLPAIPVINTGGSLVFCEGENVVLTSSAATGNSWFKDGIYINSDNGNQSFTAAVFGNYSVHVANSNGCVSISSATVVTVNGLPAKPVITANSATTFCSPGNVMLSSSSASGNQWYKDGVVLSGESGQTYSTTSSGSYTVIVTNGSGCTSTASNITQVTVNTGDQTPTITATTPTTFCQGGVVLLISSSSDNNQWFESGNLIPGATGNTYTATTSGSYTVTATNIAGCVSGGSSVKSVTVNPLPAINAITGSTVVCANATTTLANTITGGAWSSSNDGIATVNNTTGVVTGKAEGTAIIMYTTNNGTCINSAAVTVTVNPLPVVQNIMGANGICIGKTSTLSSATAGGNWSSNDNSIATINSTTGVVNAIAAGTVTITYSVTNGNNCTAATASAFTVNAVPVVAAITGNNTVCVNSSTTLSNTTAGGVWSSDNISVAGVNSNGKITGFVAGSTTIHYTATNISGCVHESAITITVNELPTTAPVTGPKAVCTGSASQLANTVAGGIWGSSNTSVATVNADGMVTGIAPGNVVISYTVTTGNGCTSASTTSLSVNGVPAQPVVSANGTTVFCDGGTVLLSATPELGYQWLKNGKPIANTNTQNYTAAGSGNYTVQTTNQFGCKSIPSAATTVTVNTVPPVPAINAAGPVEFCSGVSVVLNSNTSSGNQWFKDDIAINGATMSSYSATVSGIYSVVITGSNNCKTVPSNSIHVFVTSLPETPTVSVSGKTSFCEGGSVSLFSNTSQGNQWYKDGNPITDATGSSYIATQTGIYAVRRVANGCISSISNQQTVTVFALPSIPVITAASATSFCSGEWVSLSSNAAAGNQWRRDNVKITDESAASYTASISGVYTVIVTNGNDCTATSAGTTIVVKPKSSVSSITGDKSICVNAGTQNTSATPGGVWGSSNPSVASVNETGFISGISSGTSTINYTVTNIHGCSTTVSGVITVNTTPVPPSIIAQGATTFCQGGSVLLTSSSSEGNQWYLNGTKIIHAIDQQYTAATPGVYTVIVMNTSGCVSNSASAGISIIINDAHAQPVISANGSTSFCSGGNVVLSSSAASGNQWYAGNTAIPGATGSSYTATASGIYTVRATSNAGCSSPQSQSSIIDVIARPQQPVISAEDPVIFCEGDSALLRSSSATGNQWYKGGQLIAGAVHHTYAAASQGIYTVEVNGISGCKSIPGNPIQITVRSNPLLNEITGSNAVCTNTTIALTNNTPGGLWATDHPFFASVDTEQGIVRGLRDGTATISYSVTDNNGCSSSVSKEISINPTPAKPDISANGPLGFCEGASVQLFSTNGAIYRWYYNGNIISSATAHDFTATAGGTYTAAITGPKGCNSPISEPINITVNPIPAAPVITANGATAICAGTSVILSSNKASGNQWYKNGVPMQGYTSQTANVSVEAVYTISVTNSSGCASSAGTGISITVNPLPFVARLTGPTSICVGQTAFVQCATAGGVWSSSDNTVATINSSTGEGHGISAGPVTVRYTVTDANGCTAFSEGTGSVKSLPEPAEISNASSTAFCNGHSVILASSSGTGNQWLKDGNPIPGATGQGFLATTSGLYTVSITGGTGCVTDGSSESVQVIVYPLPVLDPVTGLNQVCVNKNIPLANTAAGGKWSSSDENIARADMNGLVTAIAAGNANIHYTLTNNNGCTATQSLSVTSLPQPSKPIVNTVGTTVFCEGGSVQLSSDNAASYQWYKNNTAITGAASQNFNATSTGAYTIGIISANGCVSERSDEIIVGVNTIPNAPVITAEGSLSFCSGNAVTLKSNATGNNQWYKNGVIIPGAGSQTYNALAGGSYTVRTTSPGSCTSVASTAVVLIENPLPEKPVITPSVKPGNIFTIGTDGIIRLCHGDSGTLTSSAATGNQWYRNGNIIAGAVKRSVFGSNDGKFTVAVTNNNGCSISSDTVYITLVSQPPLLGIEGIRALCEQNFTRLNNATPGGVWSSSNPSIAVVDNNGNVNGIHAGNAAIEYTVTYQNGCVRKTSSTVTINPKPAAPVITASGAVAFCEGSTVNIVSNLPAGNHWYRNGEPISGITRPFYTAVVSGNYSALFLDSVTGCLSNPGNTISVTVNANPAVPVITITGAATFCTGNFALLTSSATSGNQWYRNDTLLAGATEAKYEAKISGYYTTVITSTNGCNSKPGNRQVVKAVLPPEGSVLGTPSQFLCKDSSIVLQAVGGSTYRWYNNNQFIPGVTDDSLVVKAPGNYHVVMINDAGCETVVDKTIAVSFVQKPAVDFTYDGFCQNKPVYLQSISNVSQSGNVSYFWTDGVISSKISSASPTYLPTQSGAINGKLVVTPFGCPAAADSIIKQITVNAPTPAIRMAPVDVVANEPILLQARGFGTVYNWLPATFLSSTNIQDPTVQAAAEQEYTIEIRDAATCVTVDTLKVRVHNTNTVRVPTVFTPNGDGLNDKLYINYVGIRELKVFRIYNRLGRKMFETKNLTDAWDGNVGYEKMPMDSYTWMIEAIDKNGKPIYKQGTITLLR